MPTSTTRHRRSLRALPVDCKYFVTYLFGEIVWIHFGLRKKDCILMFEADVIFQLLYLLTECLTHCLVVSFTDIYRSGPSATP